MRSTKPEVCDLVRSLQMEYRLSELQSSWFNPTLSIRDGPSDLGKRTEGPTRNKYRAQVLIHFNDGLTSLKEYIKP